MWCGGMEINAGNWRVRLTCGVAPLDLQPADLRQRVDSSLAGLATALGRAMGCAVSVRTDRRHTRPAKGEPARAGSKPCAGNGNGSGDA